MWKDDLVAVVGVQMSCERLEEEEVALQWLRSVRLPSQYADGS